MRSRRPVQTLGCVTREDKIAGSHRVAGRAGFQQRLIAKLAIGTEVPEPHPPVAAYFFESLTMN